jgi:hypothetical protein
MSKMSKKGTTTTMSSEAPSMLEQQSNYVRNISSRNNKNETNSTQFYRRLLLYSSNASVVQQQLSMQHGLSFVSTATGATGAGAGYPPYMMGGAGSGPSGPHMHQQSMQSMPSSLQQFALGGVADQLGNQHQLAVPTSNSWGELNSNNNQQWGAGGGPGVVGGPIGGNYGYTTTREMYTTREQHHFPTVDEEGEIESRQGSATTSMVGQRDLESSGNFSSAGTNVQKQATLTTNMSMRSNAENQNVNVYEDEQRRGIISHI